MDNISIAVLPSCEDMFICDRHASLTDPTSVGGTLRQGVSRLSSGCLDSCSYIISSNLLPRLYSPTIAGP